MPNTTPHDTFFKACFQNKELASLFLHAFLPSETLPLLDFSTLILQSETLPKHLYPTRYADIIYALKTHNGHEVIFIIEHQSTPDPTMLFRFNHYTSAFIDKHLKQGTLTRPAFFPLLFYNGEHPYKHDTFWQDPVLSRFFNFAFLLIDIAAQSDTVILALPPMLALVCLLFKHARTSKLLNVIQQMGAILAKHHIPEDILDACLVYLFDINEGEPNWDTLVAMLKTYLPDHQGRGKSMSLATHIKQIGLNEGLGMGFKLAQQKYAHQLIKQGKSLEQIAEFLELSPAEVQQLLSISPSK